MACQIGSARSPYFLPLSTIILRQWNSSRSQQHSKKIVVCIRNMDTSNMIAKAPEVLLEGPVKLTAWHPCLELSDDEEGKTRWRIVIRTENENDGTFIVLRELANESSRTLYVIPPPVPQKIRNRREQKQANHFARWKRRQIIITVRLEGYGCNFPSIFTHKPINFAAMARKSMRQGDSPASNIDLEDNQPETFSVSVAFHKAFLKFVANKLLIGVKAPTHRNRSTRVTKGLDRGASNDDQAIAEISNWDCGGVDDTSMNGIKIHHVTRSWHEEEFDKNATYGRYRVFLLSNLRHSWSYEEEGQEDTDGVEELMDEVEEAVEDEEAITYWEIEEPILLE